MLTRPPGPALHCTHHALRAREARAAVGAVGLRLRSVPVEAGGAARPRAVPRVVGGAVVPPAVVPDARDARHARHAPELARRRQQTGKRRGGRRSC